MVNSFQKKLLEFLSFPQRIEANSGNALILNEKQHVEDNESLYSICKLFKLN